MGLTPISYRTGHNSVAQQMLGAQRNGLPLFFTDPINELGYWLVTTIFNRHVESFRHPGPIGQSQERTSRLTIYRSKLSGRTVVTDRFWTSLFSRAVVAIEI